MKTNKKTIEFKSNYDQIKELNNVKNVYDQIFTNFISKTEQEWNENGEIILQFCRDCSTTFVKNICEKGLKYKNLSEKQTWCVSYEFLKINHMLESWIEKEIKKI